MHKLLSQYLGFLISEVLIILLIYKVSPYFFVSLDSNLSLTTVGVLIELIATITLFLVFLVITGIARYSFLLANIIYCIFIFSSLFKVEILNAPIVYYDVHHIDDLLKNIDVIGWQIQLSLIVVVFLVALMLFLAQRNKAERLSRFSAVTLLITIVGGILIGEEMVKGSLVKYKVKYKWNSNIVVKAQKFGFSAVFLQSIYFSSFLERPDNYSKDKTRQLIDKYKNDTQLKGEVVSLTQPENIVILMVESFQDTENLPWTINTEATPNYQSMKNKSSISGEVVSPVFGGKSVNAEFEFLTGFSSLFVPTGSIPYKDFVKQNIPSVARQLKANGYRSNVIQVVEMHGYGYETIYNYLGFENKYSLSKKTEGIELDPTGRFGSSKAIATRIISLLEEQQKSFVFAFPNSSHAPWNIKDYPDNNFKVKGDKDEMIAAYLNALNHVDDLFGRLKLWAETSNEDTVIVIVGDHQPSLLAKIQLNEGLSEKSKILDMHKVPYLIWSNRGFRHDHSQNKIIGMNFLISHLFEVTGIKTTGFYAFLDDLRKEFDIITEVFKSPNNSEEPSLLKNELIQKYQFIQYFYLSGDKLRH